MRARLQTAMKTRSSVTGVFNFPDGSDYFGDRQDRRTNGTITYGPGSELAGDCYVGELLDGYPHGKGAYTFADGHKLVGQFRNGTSDGRCTLTFGPECERAGHVSTGIFRDFVKCGWGTYECAEYTYIGHYWNGLKHGSGTTLFTNGDKYVGDFRDDWWNGQGKLSYARNGSFAGEFRDGLMHGKGTQFAGNGDVWQEGVWEYGELVWRSDPFGPVVEIWAPSFL
jgi:hypothetical protein